MPTPSRSLAALLLESLLLSALAALAQPLPASAQATSFVSLLGVTSAKSGHAKGEVDTAAVLSFDAAGFQLSFGPCYGVSGSVTPRGRSGAKLKLVVDDASRSTYRDFMALLAASAGVQSAPASKDRTKLVLLIAEDQTAELRLKSTLRGSGKKARRTSLKAALGGTVETVGSPPPPERCRLPGPSSSQPLALPARGDFLVAANPETDSVSFFDVRGDANRRIAEVPVQDEPNGVAFLPDGSKAYVANAVSGTVTVIPTDLASASIPAPSLSIPVGTEPYGLALTPNGTKLYVSNQRSGSVSVIDTATDTVIGTIAAGVGPDPRGLAVSNDGDGDDGDELLYVTQFLSQSAVGVEGADDAKEGLLTVIDTAGDAVVGYLVLPPLADTGFEAAGDALGRVAPGSGPGFTTGAYPNQLNGIALKGQWVYVPNPGASPNGPLRFDVNVQSLLSWSDAMAGTEPAPLNMQLAVASQASDERRFLSVPWALAFEHGSETGFVVSAASDVVAKVAIDPTSGAPSVELDPDHADRVLEIPVGKNPRGIVINAADSRAYVMNHVSRDVSVLDLTKSPETAIATMPSADLPAPGTSEALIHLGLELYNSSIGRFDPVSPGKPPIVGRLSKDGWGSCSACHPDGLSDGVVWIFPDGPRRTIPQHADFDPSDPLRFTQRILDWSASRDEVEDFELNIRAVSGGDGLIVLGDGVTPDPDVADLLPQASGGRNQLRVGGVPAWDALRAYVQFGIRAPISPQSKTDPDAVAGRALFISANCQQCHGGPQWTGSILRYTPPPAAGQLVDGQIVAELRNVGTFDPGAFNEVDADAGAPKGAGGFAVPSLLSAFAFESTLLHGGAAGSFDEVLANVSHRAAGTSGVDTLTSAADRAKIAVFLRSIDEASVPIP